MMVMWRPCDGHVSWSPDGHVSWSPDGHVIWSYV